MNIATVKHIPFNWAKENRIESLVAVYEALLEKINDAIQWYQAKRKPMRWRGTWLRIIAIILAAVAAGIPTLSEMFRTTDLWYARPGLATILGVVVATLLMIDKFSGCTSAWIRFTMAETSLKEIADELPEAFAVETGNWAETDVPTVDQVKHALATLRTFLLRANQVVRDETNQWRTEFLGALQQIDETAKRAPQKAEQAAGVVTITNPDRLEGPWTLVINDDPAEEVTGDSRGFRRPPGSVLVRVSGAIKGATGNELRTFQKEVSVDLELGVAKTIPISVR